MKKDLFNIIEDSRMKFLIYFLENNVRIDFFYP